MPKVNPEILRWARESAGLAPAEAAEKIKLPAARGQSGEERLQDLETGRAEPTRPLLVRMSKQYRRPLLTFYLSRPPKIGDRGQDFRLLPEDRADSVEALLDALLRDVKARQGLISSAIEDEDEPQPLAFVGSVSRLGDVRGLAERMSG